MINVCLVGCGRAGMIHAESYISGMREARIVSVADANIEAARSAAEIAGISEYETDYRKAIQAPGVNAVVVVSPTNLHKEIVLECARRGLHVFCEKPMGMNIKECLEMMEACQKAHVKLQIGFMRRFDRSYQAAKEAVDAGEIGDVVLIQAHTRGPSKPQPWMYDLKASNGILAEISSHDIDLVRWFSGSEVSSLYAVGGNFRNPEAKENYPDYYDNVAVTGTLENGVQFLLDRAAYCQYGYDNRLEVVGTKGVIRVARESERFISVIKPEVGAATPFTKSWRTLFKEAYLEEDRAFVDSILHGGRSVPDGMDGLMAVKVARMGNISIREKRIVTAEEVNA